MYLAAEGQELEIADVAASVLAGAIPLSRLQDLSGADLSVEVRRNLADLGWFSLAVPEARGGSGLSEVEHVLFFREVGRNCGPLDLLAQCLAANTASDAGLGEQIMRGEKAVSLVVPDQAGFRIFGRAASELGILVQPDGAVIVPLAGLDTSERSLLDHANTMRHAAALPEAIDRTEGERVWNLGQLATSAMLIGVAEAALDLIVDYAKIRETFGRKIGSYQAVRHPCADMAVRLEASRAQLWYAASATKEGHADAAIHRDAAKILANMVALGNTDTTIQLHGGIGVTYEHDAHFLLKHSLVLSRIFGTRRNLLARLLHARLRD